MRLLVLGPFEIAAGGRRSSLASVRRRTLLGVLVAARGRVVSADRLVDALWGDQAPSGARTTLRSHVSQLRRHLDELEDGAGEAIATRGDGYCLDLDGHELDATRFEEEAARASAILQDDPSTALRLLGEALGRWRGPAFGDLADHHALRVEARRLEQARATASVDRAEALLALGRHRDAVAELEALATSEPLDERLHGRLMLARYRSGRQADALATYRDLQERLRDELGVDPAPDLQRLHEQILRQDPGLDGAPAAPGPPTRPRPDTAPRAPAASVAELVGRRDETQALRALATQERLVTLVGPGGVGKSRLAEDVANGVAESFDDGVAMCALSPVRSGEDVGPAMLDALGLEHGGTGSAVDLVVAALEGRRLLLVLDNCEHVSDALAPAVEAVLDRCRRVTILATSREPLRLAGERVWQVAPLAVPRRDDTAEEVGAAPAAALFAARARAADPAFSLTDDNAAAVAELCRRLDGLPLAIELAAARMRALDPADLVARLDRRFALLTDGPRRDEGRHRTLRAVVEWSHRLLTDAEARLFERLSVFAGAFTLSMAEHVGAGGAVSRDEVAGLLAELVDRSMVTVERDDGPVRYRLLDTLRAFGAERLEASGQAESSRRAHATCHVTLVEELGPQVRGVGERDAVAAVDHAIEDLRVAQAWLVEAADADGALRLPAALHEYLLLRPRAEAFAWAERALALPQAADHPAYPAALATAALGAVNRGETQLARRRAQEALAGAEHPSQVEMRASVVLSIAALYEGRLDDVPGHAERVVAVADALADPYYRALALLDPTLASLYRGERGAARAHADELARRAEAVGNLTVLAWARYVQGETRLDDDPAEAERRLEAAIDVAREVDSHLPLGAALVSLASLRGRHGDPRRALPLFREAIVHWRRLGDHTHQLTTLRNLVELLARLGEDEAAARLHGAVTSASPPSFGAEAERLDAAGRQLRDRLGDERVNAAAGQGRHLGRVEMADEALATLDKLLSA